MIVVALSAMMAQAQGPRVSLEQMPTYMVLLPASQPDSVMPDSVFNGVAGQVIYRVSSIKLNTADAFVRDLADRVLPMANQSGLMLVGIDIRGGASPEGPYDFNVWLSRNRANELYKYITPQLDSVAVANTEWKTVPEDWPYVVWLMRQAGDQEADIVQSVIDRHTMEQPAKIKAEMRAIDKGRLWKRLLREYFPTVRAGRIVLYFREIHPKAEPIEVVPELVCELTLPQEPQLPAVAPRMPMRFERPHMLSVSSNLLYDAFYMPNYGMAPMPNVNVEFFPKNSNLTIRAGFMFPYYHRWDRNQFFQIRDYHIGARWYFRPGSLHTGMYAGAYINNAKYGIGLSAKKGWQGEAIGGALKAGYVLPLGDGRWRLDFSAAFGVLSTRYDPYVYGNPVTGDIDGDYYYDYTGKVEDFRRRNYRLTWLGPTEVGITISYDLLYWRRPRGASMRRYSAPAFAPID